MKIKSISKQKPNPMYTMNLINLTVKRAPFFSLIICLFIAVDSNAQAKTNPVVKTINLLDDQLNYWYKWIGVPHTSVEGLPAGTVKGDGMNGVPLGMSDPKEVFKVVTINNEKILKVSGEIYGSLNTKAEYTSYHLQLKYKWGSKKWEPRLDKPKDCGIMFHLTSTDEGGFWSVFNMGAEFQISEKTTGDLFLVPNKAYSLKPIADVRVGVENKWDPSSPLISKGGFSTGGAGIVSRSENHESNAAEWTTVDLYTIGGSAIYLVNGHVVMAFENAGLQKEDKSITPLNKGKILLQSEGAEVFYKDVTIQEITEFPQYIRKAARFELGM